MFPLRNSQFHFSLPCSLTIRLWQTLFIATFHTEIVFYFHYSGRFQLENIIGDFFRTTVNITATNTGIVRELPKSTKFDLKGKNHVWNLGVNAQSLKSAAYALLCQKERLSQAQGKERMFTFPTYFSLPSPRMHPPVPVSKALLATPHLKLRRVLPHRYNILLFKVLCASKLLKNHRISRVGRTILQFCF